MEKFVELFGEMVGRLIARAIFIFLAAIPIYFFWNTVVAYNFNLSEFTYMQFVLAIVSGYAFDLAISARESK